MNDMRKKNGAAGFTLVELMIVVAIIGILMAIAIPNYRAYVLKSHRTAAINGLLDLANREARYYTSNNTYTNSLTTLGYASSPMPVPDATSNYYQLSITASTASSFTITAAAQGGQTADSCGDFTYTDLGVRGVTGTTPATTCWGR